MSEFKNQLKQWAKQNKISQPDKKKEKLSQEDLNELMGVNRQTLKRGRGGAYKQK